MSASDYILGSNRRWIPCHLGTSVLCGCLAIVLLAWHVGGRAESQAQHPIPPESDSDRSPSDHNLISKHSFLVVGILSEALSDVDPEEPKSGHAKLTSGPLKPWNHARKGVAGRSDGYDGDILLFAPKIGPPVRILP